VPCSNHDLDRQTTVTTGNRPYAPDARAGARVILSFVHTRRTDTATATATTHRTILRRPLATARPGLDFLRAAFIATWEACGITGVGELAPAYVHAAQGTPEAQSAHVAVARWAVRLQGCSSHRSTC
jgi:hypothetical protein